METPISNREVLRVLKARKKHTEITTTMLETTTKIWIQLRIGWLKFAKT